MDEQRLDEAQLALVDADGIGAVQVERAHLDVLDAALGQRDERTALARLARLRPDRAVVLVLDLQHVGVELPVVAVHHHADGRVTRLFRRNRAAHAGEVLGQRVGPDAQPRLRLVAVAEIAHAQRRGERRVPRCGIELREKLVTVGPERTAQRGRRAEQIRDEPCAAAIVAREPHELGRFEILQRLRAAQVLAILGPELRRQRIVEMHAGDRLHGAAVAKAQAAAIHRFHAAEIRRAVVRNRNLIVGRQVARHAGRPEQLAV